LCSKVFLFFLIFWVQGLAYGQVKTTEEKIDSAKVYQDIKKFSSKSKFSRFIYSVFFKHAAPTPVKSSKRKQRPNEKFSFKDFEGKIIRGINVISFDPFGYSVKDTALTPHTVFNKTANKVHIKTKQSAIKDLLLFHKNQPLDSLLMKESERLIRAQKYVREVLFYYVLPKSKNDSADIFISVQDIWSITPNGASLMPFGLTLKDENFLGLGHQFQNSFRWNSSLSHSTFETDYFIPSFKGSYISSLFQYRRESNMSSIKRIDLERTFYSPFTTWAGGLNVAQQFLRDSVSATDTLSKLQNFKYNTQDLWVGRAWKIYNSRSEEGRTTKLILTGRFLRTRYLQRPTKDYDSLRIFSNENLFLAGAGITTRKYRQDRYVFNFGLIEDIPIGRLQELVGGVQYKNQTAHGYLGLKISWGNYYNAGYFSTHLEYGTFFNAAGLTQEAFSGNISYFTDLMEIGQWKFRQFVKPQVMIGFHRLATDKISLNDEFGIKGFNSTSLWGVHKMILTIQSQAYAPWNVFGFRFGPYMILSMGMLGNATTGFRHSKLYSLLGMGVLVKNDFLNLSYFQISLAFYPMIPGLGNDVFKFNPYKTTDYGFQNFDIGKPEMATYQ
jgi:hypothetical protein